MRLILSTTLITVGVFLWFWGSFQLSGKRRYLWKIHALGAADTIGTFFILAGSLVYSLENWPHILLAMGAVIFWGTAFSFVMARLGRGGEGDDQQ
jgi:multicomponent Na+:H+ antiporter subunit G